MVINPPSSNGSDSKPSDQLEPVEDEPPIPRPAEKSYSSSLTENQSTVDLCQLAHVTPINDLATQLQVHLQHGLSVNEAAARLAADGPNKIKDTKQVSPIEILLRQVSNALTYVSLSKTLASMLTKSLALC